MRSSLVTMAAGLTVLAASAAVAEEGTPLIAQACAGCHGQNGVGQGAIPAIAGLDRDATLTAWAEFRADERPATIMNRIARGYTEAEIIVLAEYFASLR